METTLRVAGFKVYGAQPLGPLPCDGRMETGLTHALLEGSVGNPHNGCYSFQAKHEQAGSLSS